jgi:serine/threonine-protein kinase
MPICPICLTKYPAGVSTCTEDGTALAPDEAFAYVDRELAPGDKVGEYQIEGKLGEGGFGAVYKAVHPLIGKSAAVKVLGRQFSSNPQMVSRFIAEARAVNQIRHKNIIDIFSFGQLPDGRQYYVMELLDGMPFDKYLRQQGRLTLEQALPILRAVARAVDAAHAKGILHRDLKPENVFLVFDDEGAVSPKLLDFGLVKLLGETSGSHKTKTGTPMGTPYYMSPEQVRGKEVDNRTDVYAFGAMTFEVLTGRVPFDGESQMDVLLKHLTNEPPNASELAPGLTPAVDASIKRALAKEPADRPASLTAALDAIAAAAGIAVASSARSLPRPDPSALAIGTMATMATVANDGSESGPVRVVTGAGPKPEEASAKGAQTFLGAEADVAPARSSRTPLVVAAIAVVAAVVAAVSVASLRRPSNDPTPATGLVQTASQPSSTPSAASSAAPSASASAVVAPSEIELKIDGAPPGARVAVDGKDLGAVPGPFKLARGTPVRLSVSAKGYKLREIPITPTESTTLPVTLEKQAAQARPTGPAIPSDLEGFDKKP